MLQCTEHTPRNSHLFLKSSSCHRGGGGGRGRSERKREVCTSVINTQNLVPRLPSSKVYHASESAAKNKRLFSAFSSKPTKKKKCFFPSTPSMLKETPSSSHLMPTSMLWTGTADLKWQVHIGPLNTTILLFQIISILLTEETVVITKQNV